MGRMCRVATLLNVPSVWIEGYVGRCVRVAENVVLILLSGGDRDEVDTTCVLIYDVQVATEPVDCQGYRHQKTLHDDLATRSTVQPR